MVQSPLVMKIRLFSGSRDPRSFDSDFLEEIDSGLSGRAIEP